MTEWELGQKVHLNSETLAPLLKRLEKTGYINRIRPDHNERKLYLSLTESGIQLKKKAKSVPSKMQSCIPLPKEDQLLPRDMLNRALSGMDSNT